MLSLLALSGRLRSVRGDGGGLGRGGLCGLDLLGSLVEGGVGVVEARLQRKRAKEDVSVSFDDRCMRLNLRERQGERSVKLTRSCCP